MCNVRAIFDGTSLFQEGRDASPAQALPVVQSRLVGTSMEEGLLTGFLGAKNLLAPTQPLLRFLRQSVKCFQAVVLAFWLHSIRRHAKGMD